MNKFVHAKVGGVLGGGRSRINTNYCFILLRIIFDLNRNYQND
jgi:hypothetical protein